MSSTRRDFLTLSAAGAGFALAPQLAATAIGQAEQEFEAPIGAQTEYEALVEELRASGSCPYARVPDEEVKVYNFAIGSIFNDESRRTTKLKAELRGRLGLIRFGGCDLSPPRPCGGHP